MGKPWAKRTSPMALAIFLCFPRARIGIGGGEDIG